VHPAAAVVVVVVVVAAAAAVEENSAIDGGGAQHGERFGVMDGYVLRKLHAYVDTVRLKHAHTHGTHVIVCVQVACQGCPQYGQDCQRSSQDQVA
jgi:hypothetical protein